MIYKVSNIVEKEWNGKKFFGATLTDEDGISMDNVGLWDKTITLETKKINGTLEKNDAGYWRFTSAKKAAGKKFAVQKDADQITSFQNRKADSIKAAQDRSSWMWAKNNASELLAKRGWTKGVDLDVMANEVIELATKIYNGEPTTPF